MKLLKNRPLWFIGGLTGVVFSLLVFLSGALLGSASIDSIKADFTLLLIYVFSYLNFPAIRFARVIGNFPFLDQLIILDLFAVIFANFILGALLFDVYELLFRRQQYAFNFQKKILYTISGVMICLMLLGYIVQP